MSWAQRYADEHAAEFNRGVVTGDFAGFLTRFADDATVRFENVPGAGVLEFTGRDAYTAAYRRQPPDDQIDITGPVSGDEGALVIPFAWRGDRSPGTLHLTLRSGQIHCMVVTFG
jgi:SnoaL-like domain